MRRLALVLAALGIGVALASLLGPLGFDVIRYHVVDDVLNQVIGGDAVALILVAPVSLVAAALVWRRHRAGPIVALAPAAFAMYFYAQLAMGGEFASEPGNSERYFLLLLAVFILGGAAFAMAWTESAAGIYPEPSTSMRRTVTTVLFLVAAFLAFGLHLRGLVDIMGGAPYGVEYVQSPAVFWVVKFMDLGIVVPLALVAGVGVLRRTSWASKLMYMVVGWGALLGSAVAAMGVVMVVNDDPAASTGAAAVFVCLAVAFLVLAFRLYRPLFTMPATGWQPAA